jgi:demethylmenaquinone methyltransferase/2-methoxy-6-polyprenyl-1,4-benzoquinol methylase
MEKSFFHPSPAPLHGMFTAVPPRYDLVNRIVTLGMDRRWRWLAASACLEMEPRRILDLGCGTGDLSISVSRIAGKDVAIFGLDYSTTMLDVAREKAARADVTDKLSFIHGEATHLPFPDSFFDVVGISFAFRNLTYKTPLAMPHLAEVNRVLRAGGRYVIVESSQPENRFIRSCFRFYLRFFVQLVGVLLSGNRGAYRYLAGSAAGFYSPGKVREMLLSSGFRRVSYRPLFFGAAGIHVAEK